MKKLDAAREWVRRNKGLVACPHCRGGLFVSDSGSLACPRGHSFDIARQGYVNLLTSTPPEDYGAGMLRSRRLVIEGGLFGGLLDEIAKIIGEYAFARGLRSVALLDAGSGEGSMLAGISGRLAPGREPVAVGLDISRDGVRMAAARYGGALWCVGDIARLPLADGSIDAIVNILSPSNYAEFGRVLKPGGLLVKAAPGSGYLRELRQELFAGEGRQSYTNDPVVRHFEQRFRVTEEKELSYAGMLPPELAPHLAAMTPMTWNAEDTSVRRAVQELGDRVTMEFALLVGQNEG